eukprot:TRINITY_DN25942_c0_g1_i1.p1 TRINITY_DN25942_c0_g1~~TRINITY_DN25942_c0_g1_i1.p1  ORF type:complete len:120 (-),score=19.98 TRINITY_DN25942_c0_g1_i1:447-806(-)
MELFTAAGDGDLEKVAKLLAEGAMVDEGDVWTGWIPLHAAAEAGHAQVTDLLLSKGANVELCTDTGYNALHLAASGGHIEVCQKLVKAGSPLDQITDAGLYGAPLHYAAGKVNRGFVRL